MQDLVQKLCAGEVFTHRYFLDEHMQPVQCVVTSVRNGRVYWRDKRNGKGKGEWWFPIADADKSIMPTVKNEA